MSFLRLDMLSLYFIPYYSFPLAVSFYTFIKPVTWNFQQKSNNLHESWIYCRAGVTVCMNCSSTKSTGKCVFCLSIIFHYNRTMLKMIRRWRQIYWCVHPFLILMGDLKNKVELRDIEQEIFSASVEEQRGKKCNIFTGVLVSQFFKCNSPFVTMLKRDDCTVSWPHVLKRCMTRLQTPYHTSVPKQQTLYPSWR